MGVATVRVRFVRGGSRAGTVGVRLLGDFVPMALVLAPLAMVPSESESGFDSPLPDSRPVAEVVTGDTPEFETTRSSGDRAESRREVVARAAVTIGNPVAEVPPDQGLPRAFAPPAR